MITEIIGNADLDKIYDKAEFPLGGVALDGNGSRYRFLKYNEGDGAVDAVAGYLGVGLDSAYEPFEATCDYDSSSIPAIANRVMGFAQAAFTDGKFGFWQTYGPNRKDITTDNAVTQGQNLMKHATTDGGTDSHTGDPAIIGTALEADGTTTSTILDAGQAFINIAD